MGARRRRDAGRQSPGATGATYPVSGADVGRRLRVRVVAINADGSRPPPRPDRVVTGTATVVRHRRRRGRRRLPGDPPAEPAAAGAEQQRPRGAEDRRGRGRGKRLGTIDFPSRAAAEGAATRVKLAKGRYELTLCTTAGGSPLRPRCVTRRLRVKRAAQDRGCPRCRCRVPAGAAGRVTYTVRATARLFSALHRQAAAAGLLLRG